MKFLEQHSQSFQFRSAIIMEEGDYNLSPNQVKGMKVDYVFIPECDEQYYNESNSLYRQLLNTINIVGVYFGQILTYKTKNAAQLNC